MFESMKRCTIFGLMFLVGAAVLSSSATQSLAAEKLTKEQVKALVEQRLAENPKYHPGDLIAVDNVEPIFDELTDRGVNLDVNSGAEELFDSFLRDTDYLVVASHLPEGRRFMHLVSETPGAYDLMERLSWSEDGRRLLHDLILSPEGAAHFKEMLTPSGLKKLKQVLAADPGSKQFGLPTGHIYTADGMLRHMEGFLAKK
jgi:hypothetical protein